MTADSGAFATTATSMIIHPGGWVKFFKHFVDAHEGKSLIALMNEFGLEGYAAYFILMEMCAKKLDKGLDEVFTEDHCRFVFNERQVREKLRMRSTKVELFLNSCVTLVLLQFTKVKDEYSFYVPKLLESLDRDSKRARTERAESAPKKKNKKKNKKEEKEYKKDFFEVFERFAKKYQTLFPGTTKGGKSAERFMDQFPVLDETPLLDLSIDHYRKVLDTQTWRAPKTTFETYLGTKHSGFFWRDYISLPDLPVSSDDPTGALAKERALFEQEPA